MEIKRLISAVTVFCFLVLQTGCYNVHTVSLDELAKAQDGGSSGVVSMKTSDGKTIAVSENTRLGVVETNGQYTAIVPFNYTWGGSQLIAPDQDVMLKKAEIKEVQVKEISTGKTSALVGTAVAILLGGILFITLSAEDEKGFGE